MNNMKAFLSMIAYAEGTIGIGDDGYNVLVGGDLFHSYDDHPRVLVNIERLRIKSTAAGRYQILSRIYDHYAKVLKLNDFSPVSQDMIAIRMIREQGAYRHIINCDIRKAITCVNNIWASLPGDVYGQGGKTLLECLEVYKDYGGIYEIT